MSTYSVFVFHDFFGDGWVGGWQKGVRFAGFLAYFGGGAAAEEDVLGEVWGS